MIGTAVRVNDPVARLSCCVEPAVPCQNPTSWPRCGTQRFLSPPPAMSQTVAHHTPRTPQTAVMAIKTLQSIAIAVKQRMR